MHLAAATSKRFEMWLCDLGWAMDRSARTPPLDSDTELVAAKDIFADIVRSDYKLMQLLGRFAA